MSETPIVIVNGREVVPSKKVKLRAGVRITDVVPAYTPEPRVEPKEGGA